MFGCAAPSVIPLTGEPLECENGRARCLARFQITMGILHVLQRVFLPYRYFHLPARNNRKKFFRHRLRAFARRDMGKQCLARNK